MTYCDNHELEVNLEKTKIMAFNLPKKNLSTIHTTDKGKVVKIVTSYTYLGVLFARHTFNLIPTSQARLHKGYVGLASLDEQCFQLQSHNINTKIRLFHTLVTPTLLYGYEVWGPCLRQSSWSCIERVLISMMSKIIQSKRIVPHPITIVEFGVRPLFTSTVFHVVYLLRKLYYMANTYANIRRHLYLALQSSIQLANQGVRNC